MAEHQTLRLAKPEKLNASKMFSALRATQSLGLFRAAILQTHAAHQSSRQPSPSQ
jgi:hypothetical protein